MALPPGTLSAAAALGPYEGGLGVAIRTMKYGGVQGLARELGEALVPAIKQVSKRAAFQVTLVPIPTDRAAQLPARRRARSERRGCVGLPW
ncbi:MAG: hypothetical protein ACKODV_00020 [Candidatus Limnocylindrus sp.]